jgi:hypothetical protein
MDRSDYEQLSAVLVAHGGQVLRQRRRGAVYAVVAVVLLASIAGGIGAWFTRGSTGATELARARAVNLTLKDLPYSFTTVTGSAFEDLFPSNAPVVVTTTTTPPKPDPKFEKIVKAFQSCMGIEVASTTQYYDTTLMVRKDTAEMSKAPFGGCFVASQANILHTYAGGSVPGAVAIFRPKTFEKGWSRGGVTTITLPGIPDPVHLVLVEITSGHFEVTMAAIVASWPKATPFISTLIGTLLSRMKSTTSAAV